MALLRWRPNGRSAQPHTCQTISLENSHELASKAEIGAGGGLRETAGKECRFHTILQDTPCSLVLKLHFSSCAIGESET